MIEVEQTIFLPPHGNCLAACMASVLELSLDEVPNPTGSDWIDVWIVWLRPRGFGLTLVGCPDEPDQMELFKARYMPGYTILTGQSPRGDWLHAVVARDGEIVWDPSPQREMGLGKWVDVAAFQVLDPVA